MFAELASHAADNSLFQGIFKMFLLRHLWEARENPSKIYGRTAFVTSLILSEIPYSIACGSIFFVLWYFLSELFWLSLNSFTEPANHSWHAPRGDFDGVR